MLYQRGISVAISAGDLPLAVEFVESRRAQHLAHRTALHPSQLSSQPDTLQNKNDADVATSRQRYTTFVERRRALQSALHEVWFGDSPKTVEQMARLREALEQQRLAYGELNAHAMPCHAMARTTADKSGPFDVLEVEGLRAAFNQRFGRVWTAVQIEPGVVTKGDRVDA